MLISCEMQVHGMNNAAKVKADARFDGLFVTAPRSDA